MRRFRSLALVFISTILLAGTSVGGTVHYGYDGYFCASKGYLAFDYLENDVGPERVVRTTHLLKVVRFGPERPIHLAGTVNLPETLAIRWMDCNAERVEVAGPLAKDHSSFTRCVIKIGVPAEGLGAPECDENFSGGPLTDVPSLQILAEHAPPALALESLDDPGHRYQLLRHLTARDTGQGREWDSKAEIVQIDRNGAILKRLVIYEDHRLEIGD